MNLHPIFVHFPIALLTVYAVLELVPFKRLTEQVYWFYVKASLLILGTGGAFVALQTGEIAEHIVRNADNRNLIETHATSAVITSWIFGLLALAYLVSWIRRATTRDFGTLPYVGWIWKLLLSITNIVMRRPVTITLAFLGIIAVTITGALGGSIVYGPDIDPVAQFFYDLLVK